MFLKNAADFGKIVNRTIGGVNRAMGKILIKNGIIADGTGKEPYKADVLVNGSIIEAVGDIATSFPSEEPKKENGGALKAQGGVKIIDAAGMYVTPGFIDIHRHGDFASFSDDYGILELSQGLTTVVNGNCGLSVAPAGGKFQKEIIDYLAPIAGKIGSFGITDSMESYLRAVGEKKTGRINEYMLAGSGTIRAAVCGYNETHISGEQIRAVRSLIERSLADGALGVSVGLGYAPECFYTKEELVKVLEPLKGTDLPLTVHMRSEADELCEAVGEVLYIAKKLGIKLHISHLKAMGKRNHRSLIPKVLKQLEREHEAGLNVSYDVYPYTAGSTQLIHCFPHEFLEGGTKRLSERLRDPGERKKLRDRIENDNDFDNIAKLAGWENIFVSAVSLEKNFDLRGKSIPDAAKMRGYDDVFDFVFDFLAEEECKVTMIDFITCDDDIDMILKSPLCSVISDSIYSDPSSMHPRVCGTYARVIEEYVCRRRLLTVQEAVSKITLAPAQVMNLDRGRGGFRGTGAKGAIPEICAENAGDLPRGTIKPGFAADINVFRPEDIRECATYSEPFKYSKGFAYTLVNGSFMPLASDR